MPYQGGALGGMHVEEFVVEGSKFSALSRCWRGDRDRDRTDIDQEQRHLEIQESPKWSFQPKVAEIEVVPGMVQGSANTMEGDMTVMMAKVTGVILPRDSSALPT